MTPTGPATEQIAPITILLAEDHEVVRNGIRSLLEKQSDFQVVAEAANGREVLDLIEQGVRPDVILTDLNMPDMAGIELLENLTATGNGARKVVLSMLDTEKFVVRALKAGANGYLLKSVSAQEMIFALRHVAAGGEYTCAEISMRVMKRLVKSPEIPATNNPQDLGLSERDIEVLCLVAEGHTNQEIADKLFTSKRTVEGYRQHLMNATGARNTAALIKFAVLNGLLS